MTTNLLHPVRKHRFSVEEYHLMAEVGLIPPDTRVELIDGEIFDMSPITAKHQGTLNKLLQILMPLLADSAVVAPQGPVRLDGYSEPEPDLAILRKRADSYSNAHPTPEEVKVLIELSASSLSYDQKVKMPLYARHGIPELWIVDLEKDQVIRYTRPSEKGYLSVETFIKGTEIGSDALPSPVKVDAFL